MNPIRKSFPGVLLALGLFSSRGVVAGDAPGAPVLVSAASGIADVLERIGKASTEKTGTPVQVSRGGSPALSQQILKGTPTDVFVSAGPGPVALLVEYGLADEASAFPWATNHLVVIAPSGRDGSLSSAEEIASAGVRHLVIGNPPAVVSGSYAQRALITLGLWPKVKDRTLLAADVQEILGDVASGKADLGIVYATDARLSSRVKEVLSIPERTHDPIRYLVARIAHAGASPAAAPFLQFLRGPEARQILLDAGFTPAFQ